MTQYGGGVEGSNISQIGIKNQLAIIEKIVQCYWLHKTPKIKFWKYQQGGTGGPPATPSKPIQLACNFESRAKNKVKEFDLTELKIVHGAL